jgi:hypothetical protein
LLSAGYKSEANGTILWFGLATRRDKIAGETGMQSLAGIARAAVHPGFWVKKHGGMGWWMATEAWLRLPFSFGAHLVEQESGTLQGVG